MSAERAEVPPQDAAPEPRKSPARPRWRGPWFLGDHCCADRDVCNGYPQWMREFTDDTHPNGGIFACGPEVPSPMKRRRFA